MFLLLEIDRNLYIKNLNTNKAAGYSYHQQPHALQLQGVEEAGEDLGKEALKHRYYAVIEL
jgi:hypothetical protein